MGKSALCCNHESTRYFDDSEVEMVQVWEAFTVGQKVEFQDLSKRPRMDRPWVQGEIVAIGDNAKLFNGDPVVIFAIWVGDVIHLKTDSDIRHVVL